MKTLDQEEAENLLCELRLRAVTIESTLAAAGKSVPARPALPGDDVIHSAELMEGHIAALEVAAKIAGIALPRPSGDVPGNQSPKRLCGSLGEGGSTSSGTGQSSPTATERVLAVNGVKSLDELAAKRRAAHNVKRR